MLRKWRRRIAARITPRRARCIFATVAITTALITLLATTTTFFRDLGYLTRPLWDRAPESFNTIHQYTIQPPDYSLLCPLHGWTPRKAPLPRVYDAVIFSNEIDLLELRFRELYDVVDHFIILESNFTFTAQLKPLFFKENLEKRFQFVKDKVIHTTMGLTPLARGEYFFDKEIDMREEMMEVIKRSGIRDGDLYIVSDTDEIPRKKTVELLRNCEGWGLVIHLQLTNFVYSFEWRTDTFNWRPQIWSYYPDAVYSHGRQSSALLSDAGWHCSFCFRDLSSFIFKMTAYSHADRVTSSALLDPTVIQRKICTGEDIFGMLPEAYTFRDLIWNFHGAHKSSASMDLPEAVVAERGTFGFLLPGHCVREQ